MPNKISNASTPKGEPSPNWVSFFEDVTRLRASLETRRTTGKSQAESAQATAPQPQVLVA